MVFSELNTNAPIDIYRRNMQNYMWVNSSEMLNLGILQYDQIQLDLF
jgi:hypothetical protein